MKKPCSEMFCLRNQDITDAKAFFYLFFMSNSGYKFNSPFFQLYKTYLRLWKLNSCNIPPVLD
ncbi:hypothetical protein QWI44_16745, partial [Acinetobacter pittii]|nr:hypothetical protein [Acinetobacter pittii]